MAGDIRHGRFVGEVDPPRVGETVEVLARGGDAMVERIVSAAGENLGEYDQDHDEWVLLVSGTATVDVDGVAFVLRAGEYLLLPAGVPHRVARTSRGATWLAVHLPPPVRGAR